jgi:hypothetical protein
MPARLRTTVEVDAAAHRAARPASPSTGVIAGPGGALTAAVPDRRLSRIGVMEPGLIDILEPVSEG